MDELAKVIAEALYGSVAAELIASERKTPDVFARAEQQSLKAANAVRTYLASDEVVSRSATAMADEVNLSLAGFDERTRGKYLRQARAALQAAGGKQDGR